MNTLQQNKNRGFTIIEVVLVLAIAALIMLMVFIALPALQSGQRDSARKSDASVVSAAYSTAKGNNNGALVDSAKLRTYVDELSDNSTISSIEVLARTSPVTAEDAKIRVYKGARCGTVTGTDTKQISLAQGTVAQTAVVTLLEANNGTAYCLDS